MPFGTVNEKVCSTCGTVNYSRDNHCVRCGSCSLIPPKIGADDLAQNQEIDQENSEVLISSSRIIFLTSVTWGLYFFFWLYLTWKQLQIETKGAHYPVWHALALLIPVYGLFRLHKHVATINTLALDSGISKPFVPELAVTLIGLNWLLGIAPQSHLSLWASLALLIVRFALSIVTIVLAQETLNRYWFKARGTSIRHSSIGTAEKIISIVGIILWLNFIQSFVRIAV